jgi:hypothetical protein
MREGQGDGVAAGRYQSHCYGRNRKTQQKEELDKSLHTANPEVMRRALEALIETNQG